MTHRLVAIFWTLITQLTRIEVNIPYTRCVVCDMFFVFFAICISVVLQCSQHEILKTHRNALSYGITEIACRIPHHARRISCIWNLSLIHNAEQAEVQGPLSIQELVNLFLLMLSSWEPMGTMIKDILHSTLY